MTKVSEAEASVCNDRPWEATVFKSTTSKLQAKFTGDKQTDVSLDDFTHDVLSVSRQLIRKHDHYEDTVEAPREVHVALNILSETVCVPSPYSTAAPHLAQIPNIGHLGI